MSRRIGITLTFVSICIGVCTSYVLWLIFSWRVAVQVVTVLVISALGEHYVSGKGYYHYTSINGFFIGRVPLWIPFMWVCAVQSAALFALVFSALGIDVILASGFVALISDLILLEPILSKTLGFWHWTPVECGYFSWVPNEMNGFTAPFGNYFVWLLFPVIANGMLGFLSILFP